jgi:hypothetical protein
LQLFDRLIHPGDVAEGDLGRARLLPKLITFEPPPCIWFIRKIQIAMKNAKGSRLTRIETQGEEPVPFEP